MRYEISDLLTEIEAKNAEIERLTELCDVRAEIMEAQEKELSETIERLRAALKECAEDLANEITGRYAGTLDYPVQQRRYDRDMASVIEARKILNEQLTK